MLLAPIPHVPSPRPIDMSDFDEPSFKLSPRTRKSLIERVNKPVDQPPADMLVLPDIDPLVLPCYCAPDWMSKLNDSDDETALLEMNSIVGAVR